jgi:hypothetical protein
VETRDLKADLRETPAYTLAEAAKLVRVPVSTLKTWIHGGVRPAVVSSSYLPRNTSDVVWLGEAGKNGWVVLTKDALIRTNVLERTTLLSARVAAFML